MKKIILTIFFSFIVLNVFSQNSFRYEFPFLRAGIGVGITNIHLGDKNSLYSGECEMTQLEMWQNGIFHGNTITIDANILCFFASYDCMEGKVVGHVLGWPLKVRPNLIRYGITPASFKWGFGKKSYRIDFGFFRESLWYDVYDTSGNKIGWESKEYNLSKSFDNSGYNEYGIKIGFSFGISNNELLPINFGITITKTSIGFSLVAGL